VAGDGAVDVTIVVGENGSEAGYCSDRFDNDSVGFVDCSDPDCALDPVCLPAAPPPRKRTVHRGNGESRSDRRHSGGVVRTSQPDGIHDRAGMLHDNGGTFTFNPDAVIYPGEYIALASIGPAAERRRRCHIEHWHYLAVEHERLPDADLQSYADQHRQLDGRHAWSRPSACPCVVRDAIRDFNARTGMVSLDGDIRNRAARQPRRREFRLSVATRRRAAPGQGAARVFARRASALSPRAASTSARREPFLRLSVLFADEHPQH